MSNAAPCYRRHRFPIEIISHAVWLYYRFCLSFRDVEDLLAERGIVVTHETIRQWCRKFGPAYARKLRRRQGRLGDTWRLDELFVPTRQRERQMRTFKSAAHARHFLSVHGLVRNLFNLSRHRLRAGNYRLLRSRAFAVWCEVELPEDQRIAAEDWPDLATVSSS